jgi:O-glycosyl hydrolase
MMPHALVLCAAVLVPLFAAGPARAAEPWRLDVDTTGQVWGLMHDGALLPLQGLFQVAAPSWRPYSGPRQVRNAAYSEADGARRWSADVRQDGLGGFRYEQTVREQPEAVQIDVGVRAESALTLDGVYYRFYVPASVFGGGRCALSGAAPKEVALPAAGTRAPVASQQADAVAFTDAAGNRVLTIALDRPLPCIVNSSPGWLSTPFYDVLTLVRPGNLAAGQEAALSVRLSVAGHADHTPARLRLDPSKDLYRFDGFGGTFCYWPDTIITPYTIEHLRPAWARTQMSLDLWEAHGGRSGADAIDWQAFRDESGRDWGLWVLEGELYAATLVSRQHIPLVISDWRVPESMQQPGAGDNAISRQAWPQLARSIISYLSWLKDRHGIEPALFSFNEADGGKMREPADQRDFFKVLGPMLEQNGLRTRLLAADVSNPRGRELDYARTIVSDPDARRYIAAMSFHTWGGAEPDTYRAWGELARQYDLPLFVDEVGWDPVPTGSANTLRYSLEELKIYQQVLLNAQPQAMFEWEFGKGFPLLVAGPDGRMQHTFRYGFVSQYCTLTPRPAMGVAAESDQAEVLMTAYRGTGPPGAAACAVHIANLGAGRQAVLEGLPAGARVLHAVQTSPAGYAQDLGTLAPAGGSLDLQLAPCSLLTLTWQGPATADGSH